MTERTMAVCLLLLSGCSGGGGSAGGGAGGGPGTGGAGAADLAMAPVDAGLGGTAARLVVVVPPDFHATPRQLLVAAFDHFPVTGAPSGVLYQGLPALAAGQSVTLAGDAGGLAGTKAVLAVLYVQGGGTLAPKNGVDYASAPATVAFTGGPVDVGTLTLALLPAGDGGM